MSNNSKLNKSHIPLWLLIIVAVISMLFGIEINKDKHILMPNENTNFDISTEEQTTAVGTVDKTKWNLILVNKWNSIPDDYSINLKKFQNGHSVDERIYSDLQQMINDCRADGFNPVICSSYRTNEMQTTLFNRKINQYLDMGYSQSEAEKLAGEIVAAPGTSEHQLGLALDIVDASYQILDEKQENTQVQKWLMENSWKYGFILRYPADKSNITGITYEPWHYRYVGKDDAKKIYDAGLCLEEYLLQ